MPKPLLSVVNLVERAKLYGAALLGAGVHQGLPIPSGELGSGDLTFLYCRAEIVEPGGRLSIWAPSYQCKVDPLEGCLESIRAVTPSDFGRRDATDRPIGNHLTPAERMGDSFLTALSRFYQAHDVLLGHFAGRSGSGRPEVRKASEEFEHWFLQIREVPLEPYYQALGGSFFKWLKHVG